MPVTGTQMQHECVMRSDFDELKRRVDRHGEEIYGPPGEINKGMKAIIVSLNGAVVGLKSTITMWGVIVTLMFLIFIAMVGWIISLDHPDALKKTGLISHDTPSTYSQQSNPNVSSDTSIR